MTEKSVLMTRAEYIRVTAIELAISLATSQETRMSSATVLDIAKKFEAFIRERID